MPENDENEFHENFNPNQNIISPDLDTACQFNSKQLTTNACITSTTSLPVQPQQQHQRRSSATKRNQRHSASLTRNGDKRDKKRSRTRSTDVKIKHIH